MSSRREVKQQVNAMQSDIRRIALDVTQASGAMLPSMRELAQRYGISNGLVAQSLKELVDEGVLYSVPRVGTFVGRPRLNQQGVYLLILHHPEANTHCQAVQTGFEERIAQSGGSCLALDLDTARLWQRSERLPHLAGVFEFSENHHEKRLWSELGPRISCVEFGELQPDEVATDRVFFDNAAGGYQAAQHLLELGHRKIAFLGLHGHQDEAGDFIWSLERASGWRSALEKAGCKTDGLLFLPELTSSISFTTQIEKAREAATLILGESGITAIVVTNSLAAQGLFEVLRAAQIPCRNWPAVVCFDTTELIGRDKAAHLTALRLSWEDIGRAGAELLLERTNQQLEATPQQRRVPMRLIRRLTSQTEWAHKALV